MAARAPIAVPHAAATSPRPAATPLAASSPLRARGPCGSLLYPQQPKRRLRFPVAAASAKPEAVGSAVEAAAAPVDGLAKSLQGVEVFDLNGKAVPIVDLWKDRKAVVAFARHFGCVLCRKRASLLAANQFSSVADSSLQISRRNKGNTSNAQSDAFLYFYLKKDSIYQCLHGIHAAVSCLVDAMEAAGVALVLIGPGTVEQAKTFYDQTKFKGEVYADPSHSSYNALEFAFGLFSTCTPSAELNIIQLYMEGYRQDWELSFEKTTRKKDEWYQGGLLVAGPGIDNILYIHKDKEAGDDPDMEDVLKACCS